MSWLSYLEKKLIFNDQQESFAVKNSPMYPFKTELQVGCMGVDRRVLTIYEVGSFDCTILIFFHVYSYLASNSVFFFCLVLHCL